MEEGIIVGSESEQKSIVDFNSKTNHVGESGKILNIPENKVGDMGAFVLFATNTDDIRRIGLVYEKQEPISKSMIKSFTFEIPVDYPGDLRDLVAKEVMDQAGFEITNEMIEYLGKAYVGNEKGQFCMLFGITVDKTNQATKTSKEPKIMESSHFWAMNEEIPQMEDWVCQLIAIKRYTSKKLQLKTRINEVNP